MNEGSWVKRSTFGLFGLILTVFAVVLGWFIGKPQITLFLEKGMYQGEFLILFILSSVFVFSFVAYQLFQRQNQIESLVKDFGLLGIIEDGTYEQYLDLAEKKYNRSYNIVTYVMFVTISVYVVLFGLSLFFWPPTIPSPLVSVNTLQAMRYGFIGAFIFSVRLVYRRYRDSDLQPTVYFYTALILIAGIVFNYVAFEMVSHIAKTSPEADGAEAAILAVVAFSLGYFPYLAVRWFQQMPFPVLKMTQRRSDALPLSLIDGISDLHEARLQDEGIDNIQNLNSAPLEDLLINTRFSAQQVIEWVDQAALYTYLEPGEIESFRRTGVRTLSDFHDAWEHLYDAWDRLYLQKIIVGGESTLPASAAGEPNPNSTTNLKELRDARATQFQTTAERLDSLYRSTKEGPNVHHIRHYWGRALQQAKENRDKVLAYRRSVASSVAIMHRMGTDYDESQLFLNSYEFGNVVFPEDDSWDNNGTSLSFTGEAIIADKKGNYERAEQLYIKAIERDPMNLQARNNLAWLYADKEDYKKNREKLQRALDEATQAERLADESDNHYATYLDTLGTVKIRLAEIETDPSKKREWLVAAEKDLQKAKGQADNLRTESNKKEVDLHLQEIQALLAKMNGAVPTVDTNTLPTN